MMEWLPEPFDLALYQRALLACLMIGFANGYASAFVLLNRSPLKLSALSHSILPGVAVAVWVSGLTLMSAFVGATLCAVLIGLLSIAFSQHSRITQDTALTVLYTGAFSMGVVILGRIGESQELEHWLFGNVLGMADADLWMSFAAGFLAVLLLTLFRRPVLLNLFEADVARTLGVRTQALNYGLFILMVLTLVTTLQAVGCILAVGLIVTPAATVRQFTQSATVLFLGSGVLGAVGSAGGLVLSYSLNLPAGASIVLVLSGLFVLSFPLRLFRSSVASRSNQEK